MKAKKTLLKLNSNFMKKYIFPILLIFVICSCSKENENISIDQQIDNIISQINEPNIPTNKANLSDFGAIGDSLTDCKPAFDSAMIYAREKGNLHLTIDNGIYICKGPIHLESNVRIELADSAKIIFDTSNDEYYLPVVNTSWEGTYLYNYSPMIYAYQKENIAIVGNGIIDGNSANTFGQWKEHQKQGLELSRKYNHEKTPLEKRQFGKGYFLRPQLMQFFECKNLLLEKFTILDAPFWCVHLLKSESITIRNLTYNAYNKNNDGIDPESCKNVLIEGCIFGNGDDNVAIKSGRDDDGRDTNIPSENIIIRNCSFKGLHGVVLGSEMSGGIKNVFIKDCTNGGYCKRGIYIKTNPDRGAFISNIFVDNVEFSEVLDCFYITAMYHGEIDGNYATDIHSFNINNLRCTKANNAGIVIQGFEKNPVRDIHFSNIQIDSTKNAISMTNTKNITMENIIIGEEEKIPSHVQ